jgi:hypothetical protein
MHVSCECVCKREVYLELCEVSLEVQARVAPESLGARDCTNPSRMSSSHKSHMLKTFMLMGNLWKLY